MKIVCFDTECANCFDGHGKVCELGYLVCDENFSVSERDNIVINPNAPFDKKGFAMQKIQLSLPYDEYYKRQKFPAFYERIRELFSAEGVIVVGHGTLCDVKYLLYECGRYSLPCFNYRFIDTQEVVRKLYNREKKLRLIDIYTDFYPEKAHEQLHSGIDDAEMTAEVLKYVCKDKNVSVADITSDEEFFCDVFEGEVVEGNLFRCGKSSVMNRKNRKIFDMCVEYNNKKCNGAGFSFPTEYIQKHFSQMMNILRILTENNLRYSESMKKCTYVTAGGREWKLRYAKKDRTVTLAQFAERFGYTLEQLDAEVDLEKTVLSLGDISDRYRRYFEYKRSFKTKK